MSTKRKPMTIASISEETDEPAAKPVQNLPTAAQDRPVGQRAHVKQLTVYLPHSIYKQLRELAFHEEKRMHSLLMEGLDRVFADRGGPSIEQLTRER